MNIFEIIGYVGSAAVLLSFLMTSVVRLRIVNMIGSLLSLVYGIFLKAYPTIIMNAALLVINMIQLYKTTKAVNEYTVLPLQSDDSFYNYFLQQFGSDLSSFFPQFATHEDMNYATAVLHEGKAVGILVGNRNDDEITIYADYTIPAYRDCSVGNYLYEQLTKDGVKKVVLKDQTNNHSEYLEKMGFTKSLDSYVKVL